MTPPTERATSLAARVSGTVALDLTVLATRVLAPGLSELTLGGDLSQFTPWPGQDVMVSVPPGDDAARWRRYTVRRVAASRASLDLWVTTDSDGPGARWASGAASGDHVEAVGPRGKIARSETASAHVFVVDASGLAAMCAMTESLAAPATARTVVVLDDGGALVRAADLWPVPVDGVDASHQLVDGGDAAGLERALHAAVDGLEHARTAAYVFGELTFTRVAAGALRTLGLDDDAVVTKAYWRTGRANESNGEPLRADG